MKKKMIKKKRLPKYKILVNKRAKHKLTKIYALKQAKRDYRRNLANWNKNVKDRDNWTCQICKKYLKDNTKNCHAHHLLDKKNYKEYSTDMHNGITLCYRCHKVGAKSPHMDALYFAGWFKKNKPEQYKYLIIKLFDKLNG